VGISASEWFTPECPMLSPHLDGSALMYSWLAKQLEFSNKPSEEKGPVGPVGGKQHPDGGAWFSLKSQLSSTRF
jgi:hypothetical protein